jgi:hypothetical protein
MDDNIEEQDEMMKAEFAREKQRRGALYDRQRQQQEFATADKSKYAGLSNFSLGGSMGINGARNYKGPSHEDSKYGGIPVDGNGEPSIMSGGQPVGLTEGNEVKYTFKDKNTYIFSDKF